MDEATHKNEPRRRLYWNKSHARSMKSSSARVRGAATSRTYLSIRVWRAQYDETVKELLMKKWRLDEMQRDEASPFAKADAQPLPLKLDAEKYKKICATIRAEVPFLVQRDAEAASPKWLSGSRH